MASITIRNLENEVKQRLRVQAAEHGRSMEAEARAILREALGGAEENEADIQGNLYDRIRAIVEPIGGVELPDVEREPIREPPKFE